MRRFILIAAMLLISASARAEGPRGLSLASNDETVAAEPPKVVEQPGDAAPQPPNGDDQAKSGQIKPDQVKPNQTKSASGKTEKPKRKRSPLEVRVVDELHRHGIYR